MKAKNLKDFNLLIKRYESITVEEAICLLNNMDMDYRTYEDVGNMEDVALNLTGFGSTSDCTLCQALGNRYFPDCSSCVWYEINPIDTNKYYPCLHGFTEVTYQAIARATTLSGLIKAYRERAKLMRECLAKLKNNEKT